MLCSGLHTLAASPGLRQRLEVGGQRWGKSQGSEQRPRDTTNQSRARTGQVARGTVTDTVEKSGAHWDERRGVGQDDQLN